MTRLFLLALLAAHASAADRFPVDWSKTNAELLEHYTALLKIDTTSPPGNETKAVTYVKAVLDREGIPNEVLAADPNRANLVARLKGNGSKRPVILMGHTDVVGVQRENWPSDPFGAVRKDGYIYGRGTLDDKDNLSTALMTMLLLKRLNVRLDRDVILVAEAGEEGSTAVGIDFLVSKHWDKIAAEFALAEGGGGVTFERGLRVEEEWNLALRQRRRRARTGAEAGTAGKSPASTNSTNSREPLIAGAG